MGDVIGDVAVVCGFLWGARRGEVARLFAPKLYIIPKYKLKVIDQFIRCPTGSVRNHQFN